VPIVPSCMNADNGPPANAGPTYSSVDRDHRHREDLAIVESPPYIQDRSQRRRLRSAAGRGSGLPSSVKKSSPKAVQYVSIPPRGIVPVQEPNQNDVLCGRGTWVYRHTGNKQLRTIADSSKGPYFSKSATKLRKGRIAASIVQKIRNMDPAGRFLRKNDEDSSWYDIGDRKAARKVEQALRVAGSKEGKQEEGKEEPSAEVIDTTNTSAATTIGGLGPQHRHGQILSSLPISDLAQGMQSAQAYPQPEHVSPAQSIGQLIREATSSATSGAIERKRPDSLTELDPLRSSESFPPLSSLTDPYSSTIAGGNQGEAIGESNWYSGLQPAGNERGRNPMSEREGHQALSLLQFHQIQQEWVAQPRQEAGPSLHLPGSRRPSAAEDSILSDMSEQIMPMNIDESIMFLPDWWAQLESCDYKDCMCRKGM